MCVGGYQLVTPSDGVGKLNLSEATQPHNWMLTRGPPPGGTAGSRGLQVTLGWQSSGWGLGSMGAWERQGSLRTPPQPPRASPGGLPTPGLLARGSGAGIPHGQKPGIPVPVIAASLQRPGVPCSPWKKLTRFPGRAPAAGQPRGSGPDGSPKGSARPALHHPAGVGKPRCKAEPGQTQPASREGTRVPKTVFPRPSTPGVRSTQGLFP